MRATFDDLWIIDLEGDNLGPRKTENVFEIQRALQKALLDPVLRARMKERGYAQAQRFSWTSSVERILAIYREVARRGVPSGVAAD